MNSLIDSLNVWGGRFGDFALPILWQSSLLIAVVFAVDFIWRHKVRAAVRYSLWFVIFVKLLLPPTLALPTGAAWWLRSRPALAVVHRAKVMTINSSEPVDAYAPLPMSVVHVAPPAPTLSRDGGMLLVASAISALLAVWVLLRWRQIARVVRRTVPARGEIEEMLSEARRMAGIRRNIALQVTTEAMSPAVCGLFRPVILLPQSLVEKLTTSQLRAVLLHELIHLRRSDVWVNCAQTLLQIVYWWHPLLWIANARVRRVREEAVDDAVMCALNTEAEVYAPTLLEVAKLAFARPLASLGLVGILESRSALRHRIERLLNFKTPRRAGVSVVSVICLAAFTALAVPMGEPPARPAATDELGGEKLIQYKAKVDPEVFVRNIQARAEGTMHTTNDDLNDILVSIMDGFGVDCTGERAIQFNRATGEVTARNTGEAVQVLDEVVKELNLKGGEHVLNPPHGLKQVVIEGHFYLLKSEDVANLPLTSANLHREGELSPWWKLSAEESTNALHRLKEMGIEPMMRPRIQTLHGVRAEMFLGDGTNNIRLACVPFVRDGSVNLTVLARTTGEYAPGENGWPDIAGHTNCAIFTRITVPNGGAGILRAEQAGANRELVILLSAKIVEPIVRTNPPVLGDLPGVGHLFRSPSNTSADYDQYKTNFTALDSPAAQLVRDGKLLYQRGKIDEGESKLQEALAKDPNNQAARYYMNLIKQARVMRKNDSIGGARARNVPGPGPRSDTVRVTDAESRLPIPNPSARTNMIFTSPQRQKIYEKLNNITFDEIAFPNLTLKEVIRTLTEQTWRRDADQQGINFILNKTKPPAATNGQPAAAANSQTEDVDLSAVMISLAPGLRNARLLDVLEAITKSADHPISYSIVDYGIEFRLKGVEQVPLHTRTFKVDTNNLYKGLQKFTTNFTTTREIQLAVINFFAAAGVDLKPPKSVFFSDRQGTLTVHATDDDLELIEQAINTLNIAPPEVTMKVRFFEINDEDMFKPGFEWFLEMMAKNGTNGSGLAGILTEPLFKTVLKNIKQRKGGDLLSEGEVTTLSGRPANFQVIDMDTNQTAGDPTNIAFGKSVDVVPYVTADGYTIQLTVTPTITERIEDPAPGTFVPTIQSGHGGIPLTGQLPLPRVRVRQVVASCTVWDGQTVVLLLQPYKPHGRNTVVFVTTTIIDASGNRKNSDESLIFAQKAVPPQPTDK